MFQRTAAPGGRAAAAAAAASGGTGEGSGDAPKSKTLIGRVRSLTLTSSRGSANSDAGSEDGRSSGGARRTLVGAIRATLRSAAPKPEPEPDLTKMTPEELEAYKVRKIMAEMARLKQEAAEVERERVRLEREVTELTDKRLSEKSAGGWRLDGTDHGFQTTDNPAFNRG